MKHINKYTIELSEGVQEIEMPFNSDIMTARKEGALIALYAKGNPGLTIEKRYFQVFVTNDEIPTNVKFIETIQLGTVVMHIFEIF